MVVSLLECRLETGRTHQIRVHLSAIDHPVVGDVRYGGGRPSLPVGRPWLHAAALRLRHPVSRAELAFDSPLPARSGRRVGAAGLRERLADSGPSVLSQAGSPGQRASPRAIETMSASVSASR